MGHDMPDMPARLFEGAFCPFLGKHAILSHVAHYAHCGAHGAIVFTPMNRTRLPKAVTGGLPTVYPSLFRGLEPHSGRASRRPPRAAPLAPRPRLRPRRKRKKERQRETERDREREREKKKEKELSP